MNSIEGKIQWSSQKINVATKVNVCSFQSLSLFEVTHYLAYSMHMCPITHTSGPVLTKLFRFRISISLKSSMSIYLWKKTKHTLHIIEHVVNVHTLDNLQTFSFNLKGSNISNGRKTKTWLVVQRYKLKCMRMVI